MVRDIGIQFEVRLVKGDLHVTVREGTASLGRSARKSGDTAALVSYDDSLGVLTPNATTPYYIVLADLTPAARSPSRFRPTFAVGAAMHGSAGCPARAARGSISCSEPAGIL